MDCATDLTSIWTERRAYDQPVGVLNVPSEVLAVYLVNGINEFLQGRLLQSTCRVRNRQRSEIQFLPQSAPRRDRDDYRIMERERETHRQPNYYNRGDYGHNYFHTVDDKQRYGYPAQPPPDPYYPNDRPPDRTYEPYDMERTMAVVQPYNRVQHGYPYDEKDGYGRVERVSVQGRTQDEFFITIPESPYTVKSTLYPTYKSVKPLAYAVKNFLEWYELG